jgi:uncharacterized membrane protein YdbT with pleckstrin-like domain
MADDQGQELSKNALKKLQKAEEAAKKKAAKEEEKKAKAAAEPAKAAKLGGDDGEELDPTQYYENRLRAMNSLEVICEITYHEAYTENLTSISFDRQVARQCTPTSSTLLSAFLNTSLSLPVFPTANTTLARLFQLLVVLQASVARASSCSTISTAKELRFRLCLISACTKAARRRSRKFTA